MNLEPCSPTEYKDRTTGLVIFGILTALLGGVCALFVPLMLFGHVMSERAGVPQEHRSIIPALVTYAFLAVTLIWLGVGSMMTRRWARALLLIFSWTWLMVGVVSLAFMALMLPHFRAIMKTAAQPGQPELPASAQSVIVAVAGIVLCVTFLILPAIWVFFYQSKHVKATCEERDPELDWTDRCPLPVLALGLCFALGAPMMLTMPLAYHSVAPFFGVFLSGAAGAAFYLILAAVWGYAAWSLYKLDRIGWWLTFATVLLLCISSILTYSRHDVTELYRLMGYGEEQVARMSQFNPFKGTTLTWLSVTYTVPLLGYLAYVRKYFPVRA